MSDSAIQCIILKNNDRARKMANILQNKGLDIRAILSPTVAAETERIRICLHAYNTTNDITKLTATINQFIDAC
jgi:8-amino-7-oxononanoate synthase